MTHKQKSVKMQALRKKAESILDTQPEAIDTLNIHEVRKVIHELQVHRIELDLQNEELRHTQQVLEKTHSRYMGLFNHAPIGYVVLNGAGMIKQVNATFTQMVNREDFKLLGAPFKDLLTTTDAAIFLARFKALTRKPGGKRIDLRFGNQEHILFYGRLEAVSNFETFIDEGDHINELLVTISDVTQEKDAIKALELERDKAQHYFNIAAAIQIVLNRDGSIAQINQAGCNLLGQDKEFIIGRNWFDHYVDSKDCGQVKAVFNNIITGQIEPFEFYENIILTAAGEKRLISWHNALLRNPDGTIWAVLSSGEDVTNKRKAEASLKAIEWLLEKPHTDPYGAAFSYNELTQLNRSRLIQDSIGLTVLRDMLGGYLDLLGTFAAVFEKNGDYAYRMVANGWCRLLDFASRALCNTDNTATALSCGRWLCHEAGFKIAEKAMISQKPEDDQCYCGLYNYAVPILTDEQCIGAMVFCYGDPPSDELLLEKISRQFKVDLTQLRAAAEDYEHRPPFIIEIAKSRLIHSARLIAALVQSKCYQASLYQERESLKVTLRSIGDGVITTDITGRIVLINDVAERLTGWSQQQAQGKKLVEVFQIINEKSRKPCENPYEKVLSTRQIVELAKDTVLISRNGVERMIADSSAPIVRKDGKIIGMILVFRDITEQVALENELRQAQKMEAIGNLAGGIAHEFNNVLSIIIGNTELAIDDLEEYHPIRENLCEIKAAGGRAKEVVSQLLNFSRKMGIRRDPVNVGDIIKEALKLLKASIPANIQIEEKIPVPLDMIMADTTQLHQLLINLCNNAAQAIGDRGGGITIFAANVSLTDGPQTSLYGLKPGRYVKLSICDTGHGIPEHLLDRIFEPYFTTKDVGKGTGMGLAVVHGIIKAHKGAVDVESRPGEGTAFNIYFPSHATSQISKPSVTSLLPTGKEHILLVDDEPSLAAMEDMMLSRLGYEVTKVINPLDALKLFQANPLDFDLVISDMAMPEMMGDQLAQEIFKIRPGTPFILCTGYNEKITAQKATSFGIKEVLHKPIARKDLAKAVRRGLK